MILRAKGAQDVDLIVEPDATFFKASWSKHTNFCQQDIEISQNSGQMAYGQEIQYQVSKLHLCRFGTERSQVRPFADNGVLMQFTRAGDLISNMAMFISVDPIAVDPSITVETVNATKYKAYTDASGVTRFLSKVFVDDLARALVNQVKLTIGNYEIETHTGDWLHLWDRFTRPSDRSFVDTAPTAHGGWTKYPEEDFHNFDGNLNYGVKTQGNDTVDPTRITQPAGVPVDGVQTNTTLDPVSTGFRWAQAPQGPNNFQQNAYPQVNRGDVPMFMYLPLAFTCCSAPALSLPMISLQYHDCKLSVKLNRIEEVSIFQASGGILRVKDAPQLTASGAGIDMRLVARYIFLDDAERRSTALSPHQYLITEVQQQQFSVDTNSSRQSYQLQFNHPITELFVFFSKAAYRDSSTTAVVNHYWNFTMVRLSRWNARLSSTLPYSTSRLHFRAPAGWSPGGDGKLRRHRGCPRCPRLPPGFQPTEPISEPAEDLRRLTRRRVVHLVAARPVPHTLPQGLRQGRYNSLCIGYRVMETYRLSQLFQN